MQYLHANELPARARLARTAIGAARCSIAVSRHTRELAAGLGADISRIEIIPPGVDLPVHPVRRPSARPTIITVARLEKAYKGHDVMVRALAQVRERIPEVRWVVVGDGPLRPELEAAIATKGLTDAVELSARSRMSAETNCSPKPGCLRCPSRLPPEGLGGEGFGIAYLEAAAWGLPAVAGNVGGAADAVEDGVSGLLVDPTEPEAVAAALIELLSDESRAAALGEAGQERAQGYAWPRIAARVSDVLVATAAVPGAPN